MQDLAVNYRQEGLYTSFLEPLLKTAEELSLSCDGQAIQKADDVSMDFEDQQCKKMNQFKTIFRPYEKLMKTWLFEELRSDLLLPDSSLEDMLIQLQWIAMEYSVIRHSIFLTWLDHRNDITYEPVKTAIVILSRMTGYETDDIYEYLENSFESLLWDWGYFALVTGN